MGMLLLACANVGVYNIIIVIVFCLVLIALVLVGFEDSQNC